MKRLIVGLLLFSVALISWGQDISLDPTFGSADLDAAFSPDPYLVDMIAGGSTDLSDIGYYGYVAEAPDFSLSYSASFFSLTIMVEEADDDTVLLVNAPDGSWYFNDDSVGLNPAITFDDPMSGRYDIWVGTYGGGSSSATLAITELGF